MKLYNCSIRFRLIDAGFLGFSCLIHLEGLDSSTWDFAVTFFIDKVSWTKTQMQNIRFTGTNIALFRSESHAEWDRHLLKYSYRPTVFLHRSIAGNWGLEAMHRASLLNVRQFDRQLRLPEGQSLQMAFFNWLIEKPSPSTEEAFSRKDRLT